MNTSTCNIDTEYDSDDYIKVTIDFKRLARRKYYKNLNKELKGE